MKMPQIFKGIINNKSIVVKNMLWTSLFIISSGIILIAASYYIQGQVLTNQLESDSRKIMEAWEKKVTMEEASEAKANKDRQSPIQRKMAEVFAELPVQHPNVAQGYLFGPELTNGNETSIIAFSDETMDMLAQDGLELGAMYPQPEIHADGVREMLETKEMAFTKPYDDDYGTWVTVLTPYQDAEGTIYAYMGIDVDASLIKHGKQELLKYTSLALLVTLLVMITLQYFITKRTFAPVQHLIKALEKLSNGDFNVQLATSKDELGQVAEKFNTTAVNINRLVTTIKSISIQSADQSKELFATLEDNQHISMEITTNIEEISDQASQQSKSIIESVTSLEEISSGVNTIAGSTNQLSDTSMDMRDHSEQGSENVERVMKQMDAIHKSVLNSVSSMEQLQKRSGQIGDIVQVITQIATQTQLLSLNASIEAARAGEEGRGFAVVANEVKKLSEESKKSAEQITELIRYIQMETQVAVDAINEGEHNVEVGIEIVQETGKLFATIQSATESVTSQIQEVSAATEEMVAETEQITASIKQLAVMAERNAEVSEEIKSSTHEQRESSNKIVNTAEHLSQISTKLEELVIQLKV
ncbi:chemotaxis protein [Paenibacillus crassostreae]|uniref:Chemotaxis protein n=2 Tax=Paenibacillus crassostreae TaxID=1763538 RepID=A0A162KQ55_9BACL|nr:chemotaxis protein [Paenibacillus crassostreae]OAB72083.1 chemotaxis protein [Paenibacillus crassostreae]